MSTEHDTTTNLCKRIVNIIGEGPDDATLAAEERDLVAMVTAAPRQPTGRWRPRLLALVASAAVGACIVAGVVMYERTSEIRWWVGAGNTPGHVGDWLHAPKDAPLLIVFDHSGTVTFDREASGVVRTAKRDRVQLELQHGRLSASVRPKGKSKWTVTAGPYQVSVTGTVFSVSWNNANGRLDIEVREGGVLVEGRALPVGGQRVDAERRLRVEGDKLEVTSLVTEPHTQEPLAETGESRSSQHPVVGKAIASRAPISHSRSHSVNRGDAAPALPAVPRFVEVFRQGNYREAYELALRDGLYGKLDTLGIEDLWMLADAARYADASQSAENAYLAVRSRFPNSERARLAAFFLGWVTLELNRSPFDATRWFELYLRDDPHGVLREEALGKLMTAYRQAGRDVECANAAKTYVETYPRGIYIEMARVILGR